MGRKHYVVKALEDAADLFESRNHEYGDGYRQFGDVMLALFQDNPNAPVKLPVVLRSAEDFARYGVLTQMVGKLVRYANNFDRGGHPDSLQDISVYSQMLAHLDSKEGTDS